MLKDARRRKSNFLPSEVEIKERLALYERGNTSSVTGGNVKTE